MKILRKKFGGFLSEYGSLIILLVFIVLALVGAIIYVVITPQPVKKSCVVGSYDIYSFSDITVSSASFSGNAFLVRGSSAEGDYIKYIIQGEHGMQVKRMEITDSVYINEIGEGQPCMEVLRDMYVYPDGRIEEAGFMNLPAPSVYVFYVPKGTIFYDFSVDLQ